MQIQVAGKEENRERAEKKVKAFLEAIRAGNKIIANFNHTSTQLKRPSKRHIHVQ